MQLAAGSVTVLLDGQGGDELLAGYTYFYATHVGALLRSGRWKAAYDEYRAYADYAGHSFGRDAIKRAYPAIKDILHHLRGDINRDRAAAALHPEILASIDDRAKTRATSSRRMKYALSQHQFETIEQNLLQSLLYFEDRNSMAFSLEARVPFLDRRLVEFCLALSPADLLGKGYTKRVLREAMRGYLPESVRLRRDKKGYPTPLAAWLRQGLGESVRSLLLDGATVRRKLFNQKEIADRLSAHEAGRADYSVDIFNWMVLEWWFRTFIDSPARSRSEVTPPDSLPVRIASV
jgi:asparagine synthase (glutamine-hydrolysing)